METVQWNSAHYLEPFHSQRTAKIPAKLAKLGILQLDRSVKILDTCCGRGEALSILHDNGFQRLYGVDSFYQPSWNNSNGRRFIACDVKGLPFSDNEFDVVMNLHALHHMGGTRGVAEFLKECCRVLKPGGRLFILDFPGSPQIRLLFSLLRHRIGTITPNLRNFADIVDEEWDYLDPYLDVWPSTELAIHESPLRVERWDREFFLYYLVLTKPNEPAAAKTEKDAYWTQVYSDPRQHERRQAQMREKLERLGLTKDSRQSVVYDLCCGMGEALTTLHDMGFHNLNGVDITPYPELENEKRFTFTVSDVRKLPVPDGQADWALSIHALHHLETAENVKSFLDECWRILKPGGKLGIIDFPSSPQIRLAFRCFLRRWWLVTPYLRWFGSLIRSEWHFLRGYLADWPQTRRHLLEGRFKPLSHRQGLFYYTLVLQKPGAE